MSLALSGAAVATLPLMPLCTLLPVRALLRAARPAAPARCDGVPVLCGPM